VLESLAIILYCLPIALLLWALTGPGAALGRDLVLPLLRLAAGGNPSAAAVLTMVPAVVATTVLTVLITLRLVAKPDGRTTVRRLVIAGAVLLPVIALGSTGFRGSWQVRRYEQLAEHLGTKELADAVTYGSSWGGLAVLFGWAAVTYAAVLFSTERRSRDRRARTYALLAGGAMAVYWAVVLPLIAHRAATVPLDDAWAVTPWLP